MKIPEKRGALAKVVEMIVKELEQQIGQIRSSYEEDANQKYHGRKKVYVCEDNGKVYVRKPRNCANYREVTVDEYASNLGKTHTSEHMERLEVAKKLLLAARTSAANVEAQYYQPERIYILKNGEPVGYINIFNKKLGVYIHMTEPDPRIAMMALHLKRLGVNVNLTITQHDKHSTHTEATQQPILHQQAITS